MPTGSKVRIIAMRPKEACFVCSSWSPELLVGMSVMIAWPWLPWVSGWWCRAERLLQVVSSASLDRAFTPGLVLCHDSTRCHDFSRSPGHPSDAPLSAPVGQGMELQASGNGHDTGTDQGRWTSQLLVQSRECTKLPWCTNWESLVRTGKRLVQFSAKSLVH